MQMQMDGVEVRRSNPDRPKRWPHILVFPIEHSFPFGAGLRFSLLGCFGKSTIVGATFGFCTLVFIV